MRIGLKLAPLLGLIMFSGCSDKPRDPFHGIVPSVPFGDTLSLFNEEFAVARGSWIIDGEQTASPHNITHIFCDRVQLSCTVSIASLSDHNGYKFLDVTSDEIAVSAWSAEQIVAESEGGCRRVKTVMDAATKSVWQEITTDLRLESCTETERAAQPDLNDMRKIRLLTADQWNEHMENEYQQSWFSF